MQTGSDPTGDGLVSKSRVLTDNFEAPSSAEGFHFYDNYVIIIQFRVEAVQVTKFPTQTTFQVGNCWSPMKNMYETQIIKESVPYSTEAYMDLSFNLHIQDIFFHFLFREIDVFYKEFSWKYLIKKIKYYVYLLLEDDWL